MKTRARVGFTLIELLVAIGLMAILMAIAYGAFSSIRAAQVKNANEAGMNKINSALERRWRAVIDRATQDSKNDSIPDEVVLYAQDDKERARVIWTYMLLKNEFPTSKAEALSSINITGSTIVFNTTPPSTGFTLRTRKMYAPAALFPTGITPEQESAICLYTFLTSTGFGGETTEMEGLKIGDFGASGGSFRAFIDSWGQPIAFVRMGYSSEIDADPYARTGPNHDPIDIKDKLAGAAWTPFWNIMIQDHANPASLPTYQKNWLPTIICSGRDKQMGANWLDPSGDNFLGFRLRREGARGL